MKKNTSFSLQWALLFMLVILGFAARILPHAPNFAPIGAIAIFSGIYLPRRLAVILPLATMLLSDAIIGFYSWQIMISVYASFTLASLIGLFVRKHKQLGTMLAGTLLGSLLFFTITNFAVWLFGTMYPHTIAGLMQSYFMALPFFRNTLLGDLFYIGVLAGSYECITYWVKKKRLILQTKKAL